MSGILNSRGSRSGNIGHRFSSGEVIQTRTVSHHPTGLTTIAASPANSGHPFGADVEIEMTCFSTSNKLLFDLMIPDIYNQSMASVGLHAGFSWTVDNWSTINNFPSAGNDQYKIAPYWQYQPAGASIDHLNLGPHTAPVPTTATMKVRPKLVGGGVGYRANDNHTQGDINTMTISEIQA